MSSRLVRAALAALALGAAPLLVAASASLTSARVDGARIAGADAEPGQWMSVGRTYNEQRFSPLDQINARTVGGLGLAWYADLDVERGVEASPLMVDGVLYNITPWNVATAYDARTGRKLWTYDPKVAPERGRMACCDIVTRGLAAWKGKVIIATLDGRLIALDARTGQPVWSVQTFDAAQAYTITGAPRVFDGKVLIGNAGGELGPRGYISAYDAETGKALWRFYTAPGKPGEPTGSDPKALAMAARTWGKIGGGVNVWDSIVYDPKLRLVYFGTANAWPWVAKFRGQDDSLFAASIVAVDVDSGRYVWSYQETPNDEWDYDAAEPLVLADLRIEGRLRPVVMQASKNGFFYVLDRRTGKLISARNFVPVTWASGIDPKSGRPIEAPSARYGEAPVLVAPGPGGAHSFNPMAYSPQTGLAYFPAVESYFGYAADPKYAGKGMGTSFAGYEDERRRIAQYADAHTHAWLIAWDPVRQRAAWRVEYPRNGSGGVLATAGGLVFQGTIDKTLAAYAAADGRKLWEQPIQNVAIGAPIAYRLDGEEYVAVNAGWGGGLAHIQSYLFKDLKVSKARLLVFKLGGKASLPAFDDTPTAIEPPPPVTAPPEQIARGRDLYARNCALCHGAEARGGVKDLRHMSGQTHGQFLDIVLGGARKAKGMASFADTLSRQEAEDIHAYLIARANEDLAK